MEGYFTSPEGINQLVAKSRVDVAAGWSINRSTGRLEDGVVAAGNFPAAAPVAIKARATIFPTLDLVGPSYPCCHHFNNNPAFRPGAVSDSSEDGIAVVLESSGDCTDRYEDTSEPPLRNFFLGSGTFATIGVDLYCTLIQGTSELVRGTCPDGVRDPGDDPGDGRSDRLAELGVGVFSRGLSSRHEGSARGNRGGRSGFSAGVRVCF